ncbi:PREDICTED: leucine-rich repeat-containing protein 59 [Nanorana parkeri]|uniref:leucine-rich repeat-containing protein 59 n=1 Tax=Nanorana parkeri TaxID=125878 RepID=UPI0008546525|nr:PREDICTED: leucine-rich repeat-containing protein 59 [Nanorana parkeri]
MARSAVKIGNLRDKLDGNELDLSLSDLNEVPVRELAALPKATVLDLSCNKLTTLPGDFCSLTHIVQLDLSKNQLMQLPSEFGRLINLQHLDLLQNRMTMLPVTFAQLKNLKWLDLKDNPLNPALAKAAGDCLDEKQCKDCAQSVLQYMKVIQEEQDRDLQRKLLEEQALKKKREAEQRLKEERDREQKRKQKAKQKARKRRDYDAQQAARQEVKKTTEREHTENHKTSSGPSQKRQPQKRSWMRLILRMVLFLLMTTAASVAVCRYTDLRTQSVCSNVNTVYEDTVRTLQSYHLVESVLKFTSQQ